MSITVTSKSQPSESYLLTELGQWCKITKYIYLKGQDTPPLQLFYQNWELKRNMKCRRGYPLVWGGAEPRRETCISLYSESSHRKADRTVWKCEFWKQKIKLAGGGVKIMKISQLHAIFSPKKYKSFTSKPSGIRIQCLFIFLPCYEHFRRA